MSHSTPPSEPHFHRSMGALAATAVNMTQMCGIGPFITIPGVIAAMNGPQAMLGWIVGAILVMCDGLVWAELGAAMPGAGGTYLYFREAYQYRTGRLMPFLFVWTAMLFIPLIMSTGVIGIVNYLGYYFPHFNAEAMGTNYWLLRSGISIGIVAVVVASLYRNVQEIGRLTTVLWVVMLLTVGAVIIASLSHFDSKMAFDFPEGAFKLNPAFFLGLGSALVFAAYDYLGYNTTAYMAAELRNPGRTIPRSIIFSIVGMMVIYLTMNVSMLGIVSWREMIDKTQGANTYLASVVVERAWSPTVSKVVTAMIIVTAFGSLFAGLLGASRIPYNAAKDKLFLPVFGRLHSRHVFPHIALLAMAVVTAIGSLFNLGDVIDVLVAIMVLIQCVGQVVALIVLRRRQPNLRRPYRMFLYPLPAVIALAGWIYVYFASTKNLGLKVVWMSLAWLALGIIAFLFWAMMEKTWPFGPKEIREEFLNADSNS